jgi:hypothetical protein
MLQGRVPLAFGSPSIGIARESFLPAIDAHSCKISTVRQNHMYACLLLSAVLKGNAEEMLAPPRRIPFRKGAILDYFKTSTIDSSPRF